MSDVICLLIAIFHSVYKVFLLFSYSNKKDRLFQKKKLFMNEDQDFVTDKIYKW